jgi:hypothetical protein
VVICPIFICGPAYKSLRGAIHGETTPLNRETFGSRLRLFTRLSEFTDLAAT